MRKVSLRRLRTSRLSACFRGRGRTGELGACGIAVACGMLAAACAIPSEDGVALPEAAISRGDVDAFAGGSHYSRDPRLAALHGYHKLFDEVKAPCVISNERLHPGAPKAAFDLDYISSREDLARALNIDFKLRAQYGPVSGDFGTKLVNSFTESRDTTTLLVTIGYDYLLQPERTDVRLTDTAARYFDGQEDAGIEEFIRRCGTSYIHGVRYGAYLYVLMELDSTESAANRELAAQLRAELPANASGELSTSLARSLTTGDARKRVHGVAYGFDINSLRNAVEEQASGNEKQELEEAIDLVAQLLSGENPADVFQYIDRIHRLMQASIKQDLCLESLTDAELASGENPCVPGAPYITSRRAAPVQIVLNEYLNAPGYRHDGQREINLNYLRASEYLGALTKLQSQIESAYASEIQAFNDASGTAKAYFNVAGHPKPDMDGVAAIANEWAPKLLAYLADYATHPPTFAAPAAMESASEFSITPATPSIDLRQTIGFTIRECLQELKYDPRHDCLNAPSVDANPYYAEARRVFEAYQRERLTPLEVKLAPYPVQRPYASDACEEFEDAEGNPYRLPGPGEVRQIAPVLAHAAGGIDWASRWSTASLHQGFWVGGDAAVEGCASEYVAYVNHADGEQDTFVCMGSERAPFDRAGVACVPQTGPALPAVTY